jgi:capsular polysaccharide biosynthesis protein
MPAPTAAYEAMRRRVTTEMGAFRRDHDDAHMEAIGRILAEFGDPADVTTPSSRMRVTFEGWLSPRHRFSRRALRARNPGYEVIVRRHPRAGLGRRGRLLRLGFRVTAVGDVSLPPFRLRAHDVRGTELALPLSNDGVAFKIVRLEGEDPSPATLPPHVPGYLDDIVIAPDRTDADRGTWLAALVHDQSSELYDFALSAPGERYTTPFADLMKRFSVNARWADRFELTARGLTGPFTSDFQVVSVERPNPVFDDGRPGAVPLPVGEHDGALVRFGDGPPAPVPDDRWLKLENVRVQHGGVVFTDRSLITYEGSADPVQDFVAGQWTHVFGSPRHPEGALMLTRPASRVRHDEGILIAGRNDPNWFHWLVEYLPRVLTIPDTIPADVPLIVTDRTPPTGIEALRELSARPLVTIDPDEAVDIGRLHVTAPPVQILDTTRIGWSSGLSINRGPLDALRQRWGVDQPAEGPQRRVFVERRSRHRGILNEHRLAMIAVERGFEVIDPASLSFDEQRTLFSSTEVLVGGSGAVMSNYLMMRPGSRILAMTSEQLSDFVLPAAIASIAGCEFTYVTGPSALTLARAADRNLWIHGDFRVRPDDFRRGLDHVLRASG